MLHEQYRTSLMLDLYQLTMAQVYFVKGNHQQPAVYEVFFRQNPDRASFSVFSGLSQILPLLQSWSFSEEDLQFLGGLGTFRADFLAYLRSFRFRGKVWSQREGEIVFPNEPLMVIEGGLLECQIIETSLLAVINHQSLIATKAQRITYAAQGKSVLEFGARRAHNFDAAYYGSRAAYLGGVTATSLVSGAVDWGIPVQGTMSHSFVQSFPDEYQAFLAYAHTFPDHVVLLLDTYDTLESGLKNAIRVFQEYLQPLGKTLQGVRIDSGDLAYLSKKIRKILDSHGLKTTKIIASNSLDEFIITSLRNQQAQIDVYGVGENLITSKSSPVFGAVYKLVALQEGEKYRPCIKLSDNLEKTTNPGRKRLFRVSDQKSGMFLLDYLTLETETLTVDVDLISHHQKFWWKQERIPTGSFVIEELLSLVYDQGTIMVTEKLEDSRAYLQKRLSSLREEFQRFENPHQYMVGLSPQLSKLKSSMLESKGGK